VWCELPLAFSGFDKVRLLKSRASSAVLSRAPMATIAWRIHGSE
jgi:hypothetical protein